MATTSTLLALMAVIGLASCSQGFLGGYGTGFPSSTTYSQSSHQHGSYGWGGVGGLYGYGSHQGAHYGGWGYPGTYGGAHVSSSPVRYHGYSVGTPHVQSYGVHFPTPAVAHHQDSCNLGGYGFHGPSFGHSVQSFSHGIGHGDMGMGYGFNDFGHF